MVGQEVVKYISMKDEPICNFLSLRWLRGWRGGLWDVPAVADEMRRNEKERMRKRVDMWVEG